MLCDIVLKHSNSCRFGRNRETKGRILKDRQGKFHCAENCCVANQYAFAVITFGVEELILHIHDCEFLRINDCQTTIINSLLSQAILHTNRDIIENDIDFAPETLYSNIMRILSCLLEHHYQTVVSRAFFNLTPFFTLTSYFDFSNLIYF